MPLVASEIYAATVGRCAAARAGLRPGAHHGHRQRLPRPATRQRPRGLRRDRARRRGPRPCPGSTVVWPRRPVWGSGTRSSRAYDGPVPDGMTVTTVTDIHDALRCSRWPRLASPLDCPSQPTGESATVASSDKTAAADAETQLLVTLATVAPGTSLRDGLERILRGRTGGLFVLGYDKDVEALCSGGFTLDVEFTATRLRELAKMDGAIILGARRDHHPPGRRPPDARPQHQLRRDGHPAPDGRAGRQADRVPGDLGEPVDEHHRPVRRRTALRPRGLRSHPLPRQPGAGHPRALQAAARRGLRHAVRPRDRGPRLRARRRRRRPTPRDGAPDRPRDRRLRRRARFGRAPPRRCSSSS